MVKQYTAHPSRAVDSEEEKHADNMRNLHQLYESQAQRASGWTTISIYSSTRRVAGRETVTRPFLASSPEIGGELRGRRGPQLRSGKLPINRKGVAQTLKKTKASCALPRQRVRDTRQLTLRAKLTKHQKARVSGASGSGMVFREGQEPPTGLSPLFCHGMVASTKTTAWIQVMMAVPTVLLMLARRPAKMPHLFLTPRKRLLRCIILC